MTPTTEREEKRLFKEATLKCAREGCGAQRQVRLRMAEEFPRVCERCKGTAVEVQFVKLNLPDKKS